MEHINEHFSGRNELMRFLRLGGLGWSQNMLFKRLRELESFSTHVYGTLVYVKRLGYRHYFVGNKGV